MNGTFLCSRRILWPVLYTGRWWTCVQDAFVWHRFVTPVVTINCLNSFVWPPGYSVDSHIKFYGNSSKIVWIMTILVSHCMVPTSVLYTGRVCKLCVNLFKMHNHGWATFFAKFSLKHFGDQVRKRIDRPLTSGVEKK